MRKKILFLFLVLPSLVVCAQEKIEIQRQKLSFNVLSQGGLMAGASGGVGQLQLVNGVQYKTYFAGAGVGIDYYYQRTVPVFLDVRKDLFEKRQTPFAYAQVGHDFVWLTDWQSANDAFSSDRKGGMFYDVGIGYKFPVLGKLKVLFSAGYSYKEYSKMENTMPWLSIWPAPPQAFQKYEYQFRRISVKTGLSF